MSSERKELQQDSTDRHYTSNSLSVCIYRNVYIVQSRYVKLGYNEAMPIVNRCQAKLISLVATWDNPRTNFSLYPLSFTEVEKCRMCMYGVNALKTYLLFTYYLYI